MVTIGKTIDRINLLSKNENNKFSIYIGNISGTGKKELIDTLDTDRYFFDTNNIKVAVPEGINNQANLKTVESFIDDNTFFYTCINNQLNNNVICFRCISCQTCVSCQTCTACNSCNDCQNCVSDCNNSYGCLSCHSNCDGCTSCTSCNTCQNGQ